MGLLSRGSTTCGLRTAIRSGGHCFAGRSSTEGIVIDIWPKHSVSVSAGVATVGAGARLGEVYDALDEHGLTIPAGCALSVEISGLTLRLSSGEIGHEMNRPVSRDIPALKGRQLEVLQLLAEGKSARDISAGLYLSQTTVRNHIRVLLQGLGAQGSRPWPEQGSSDFWSGSLARIRPF